MRATVVVDNENAGGRIVLAAYSVASMVSQVAKWLLMRMPVLSGLIAQRDRLLVQQQLAARKTQSAEPARLYKCGERLGCLRLVQGRMGQQCPRSRLDDDPRVKWFGKQLGGFAGKRILELGPLDGGTHT
jgi:hypothetical protein